MKKKTIEEIEKQSKQTEVSLERLFLEKKKLQRTESELFELHLSSLRPLRELQNLAVSAKDSQIYQDLLLDVEGVGTIIEEWGHSRREALKKKETKLQNQLDLLADSRSKLLSETSERKEHG